jgi:hypothetical protein
MNVPAPKTGVLLRDPPLLRVASKACSVVLFLPGFVIEAARDVRSF